MKSVTICSSNRFADEAEVFANKLKKLGVNVFVPHFYTKNYGGINKVKEVHPYEEIAYDIYPLETI